MHEATLFGGWRDKPQLGSVSHIHVQQLCSGLFGQHVSIALRVRIDSFDRAEPGAFVSSNQRLGIRIVTCGQDDRSIGMMLN